MTNNLLDCRLCHSLEKPDLFCIMLHEQHMKKGAREKEQRMRGLMSPNARCLMLTPNTDTQWNGRETCAELSKLDVSQKRTQVVMTKMNVLEPGAYPGTWMAPQEK